MKAGRNEEREGANTEKCPKQTSDRMAERKHLSVLKDDEKKREWISPLKDIGLSTQELKNSRQRK